MPANQYEILALTLRYWFVLLVMYIFWRSLLSTWRRLMKPNDYHDEPTGNIPFILVLFALSAMILLSLKDNINPLIMVLGVLISAAFLFQYLFISRFFAGIDKYVLLMVDTLCIIGFVMLQRLNPDLAFRQVEWFLMGSVTLLFFLIFTKYFRRWERLKYLLMAVGCALLLLTLIIGKEVGGAKNWIEIGKFNIQPSEFVKIILVFVLSAELKQSKPRIRRLPVFIFMAAVVLMVVLQKDLGAAFLYFSLFLFLYYIATTDLLVTICTGLLASVGAVLSYFLFGHVRVRIAAWRNPWADIENKGYQIAQSLIAIASGGWVGLGLGLGSPYVIPASRTDFIFAAICEEMGILVGVALIGLYMLVMIRGICNAMAAREPGDTLLAMGASISLAFHTFTIIGGVVKFIPLTGVTMPFVSYGGSSMLASFGLIGIIQGIASKNHDMMQMEAEQQPVYENAGENYGED